MFFYCTVPHFALPVSECVECAFWLFLSIEGGSAENDPAVAEEGSADAEQEEANGQLEEEEEQTSVTKYVSLYHPIF